MKEAKSRSPHTVWLHYIKSLEKAKLYIEKQCQGLPGSGVRSEDCYKKAGGNFWSDGYVLNLDCHNDGTIV